MGILKKLTNWLRPDKPAVDLTLLEGPGGQRRLVDRETLAYLESDAPQPTQASLDALLVQAQSVRVFNDGCREDTLLGNDLLLEVSDPAEIQQLRSALQIMDGPGGHCMCYGGPTFEILSSKATRLALIGVHHGQSIDGINGRMTRGLPTAALSSAGSPATASLTRCRSSRQQRNNRSSAACVEPLG